MNALIRDFRYALRNLSRKPGYVAVAVLTLALGIGSNGIIFSLVNAILLRPLPVQNSDELVRLYIISGERTQRRVSYQDYLDFRDRAGVFENALVTNISGADLEIDRSSQQIMAELVSPNYFSVLGIGASPGRVFGAAEQTQGLSGAAIISHRIWKRVFREDRAVIGQTIRLNGDLFTVAGVAPADFTGTFAGTSIDVWVPVTQVNWLGADVLSERSEPVLQMIARLKDGVSADQASAAVSTIAKQIEQAYPKNSGEKRTGAEVVPATYLHGNIRKGASIFLTLMMAVVGLVFLTACANLANLVLIAATGRKREIAIRTALGASRFAILRQFISENVVISLLGGAAGLILSAWCSQLLMKINPIPSVPIQFNLMPDLNVFLFIAAISIAAGIFLGMIPVAQFLRGDLLSSLQSESGKTAGSVHRSRMRNIFVISQVAASLVLLIGAGLFLQSLQFIRSLHPGFEPQHALATDFDLNSKNLSENEGRIFYHNLLQRISTMPSVEQVGLADLAPLDIATDRTGIKIDGFQSAGEQVMMVSSNRVSHGYFKTLGIPISSGREIEMRDDAQSTKVVVINEAMAQRFWKGEEAVGRTFRLAKDNSLLTVIGVARNAKYRTFGEEPEPHIYLPFAQNYSPSMTLLVRTSVNPEAMLDAVQREARKERAGIQGFFSRTLMQHAAFAMLPAHLASVLSGVFGVIAILLAVLGIYGTVGYSVAQRFKEIGIRVALGAQRIEVVKWILAQGMRLVLAGTIIGVIAAFALTRLAAGFLYGISPADPLTFGGAALLLIALAIGVVLIPARRAMNVDPVIALRQE